MITSDSQRMLQKNYEPFRTHENTSERFKHTRTSENISEFLRTFHNPSKCIRTCQKFPEHCRKPQSIQEPFSTTLNPWERVTMPHNASERWRTFHKRSQPIEPMRTSQKQQEFIRSTQNLRNSKHLSRQRMSQNLNEMHEKVSEGLRKMSENLRTFTNFFELLRSQEYTSENHRTLQKCLITFRTHVTHRVFVREVG